MVFSTMGRAPWISEEIERALYAFLDSKLQAIGNVPIKVGGCDDHVHCLFGLSRTVAIAKTVENIKSSSSTWMKTYQSDFAWQLGYAVFSVDPQQTDGVVIYIEGQREHHKGIDFKDEFRKLMLEHGISIDERYVWD